MSLTAGAHLGPYEILAAIGAGGMGEVYRARDTKLNRDVALKVLPDGFTADPDRLARFKREAHVLASLNHPNIAAIYGFEESDGVRALVLELVDGPTLADRIAHGPIPLDEALLIAKHIAEALEAAHEQGIVHRDLKPANVKIRPDGTVKVLDFGLARQSSPAAVAAPAAATITSPVLSSVGVILGTAAYMAPEQARGKTADRRADIWAFGCVLYEMLTATRPFDGESITDVIAAIVTRDPDWTKLPSGTPPAVRRLLHRCLERDPHRRLQAIGEARLVVSEPFAPDSTDVAEPARRLGAVAVVVFGGTMAVIGAALAWTSKPAHPLAPGMRRVDIAIEGLQATIDHAPILSPDGSAIAYFAQNRLRVRSLSDFTAKEIRDSEGGRYAFWSPDGRQVGFVRDGQAWRVPLDGGEPSAIAPVPKDLSGSGAVVWTPSGDILAVGSDTIGLYQASARGGEGRVLVPLDPKNETDFHELSLLPGGRGLLFTVHRARAADTIDAFVDGRRKTVLQLPGETLRSPVYSAGHLFYTRETTSPGIWAVRFSPEKLQIEGDPFIVQSRGVWPSVGADGTLAIVRPSDKPSELLALTRTGSIESEVPLPGPLAISDSPIARIALSRDDRRIAATITSDQGDEVWGLDLGRGPATRLSIGAQAIGGITWSHDGLRVLLGAFAGDRAFNVYGVVNTETQVLQRVLPRALHSQWPCSVTPDGKHLIYAQLEGGQFDLWIAALDGSGRADPLMKTPFNELDAHLSPDGRMLAYVSDETRRYEVYVRSFPVANDRTRVSTGGGIIPNWSGDGSQLYFRGYFGGSSGAMAAAISLKGGVIEAAPPVTLFALPDTSLIAPAFAATRDGKRFFVVRRVGDDRIGLLLNWRPPTPDK